MSVKARKIYGDTWGIIVPHPGKRWQQSVGSRKAAEIMAAEEVELELARGRVGIPGETPTLAAYAEVWLEYVELRRAPSTTRRYQGIKFMPKATAEGWFRACKL